MTQEEKKLDLLMQSHALSKKDMELRKAIDAVNFEGQQLQQKHSELIQQLQNNQAQTQKIIEQLDLLEEIAEKQ